MKIIILFFLFGFFGAVISLFLFSIQIPYAIHSILSPAFIFYFAESKLFNPNYVLGISKTIVVNSLFFATMGVCWHHKNKSLIAKWSFILLCGLLCAYAILMIVLEVFVVQ